MKEKELIIITGPTAVGKTEVCLEFAEQHNLEIVSADSRQLYKEMTIGTAKPSTEELERVKHYFIDFYSIQAPLSAGAYEREAMQVLKECFERNDRTILTGGSGLYIKAICEGLDEFPEVPEDIFQEVAAYTLERLQLEVRAKDPQYYKEVDLYNKHRLIRALSVIKVSGKPFTSFRMREHRKRTFRLRYIVLNRDRHELYERIDSRVDRMMEEGLLDEARALFEYQYLKPLQTVGYQELFAFINGEMELEKAVELIKRNSRRYAKRQLTWFRKLPDAEWMHPERFREKINDL